MMTALVCSVKDAATGSLTAASLGKVTLLSNSIRDL